ncbi:MAG TPA: DNA polymerase III subunit gamma/tau [Candidatus Polarisedimenticolia bacterium]|jgi:DNA polymerase-3 subunit gamma/tau|nr:DNA polymerase III subunit gamma/tau [Candidatus Polarisedimenticolia bacterium]
MSYQVIARKYRPQTFEEVVGQRPIIQTLENAVEQRRLHHAYLFSGPRGCGKTTVARLLAKALNCERGPTAHPDNTCSSCLEIAQSRSLDVLEIDGASNRGIDDVRELRETVRYSPARDRYKVFIIDEVHMLTDPAWNALLKTLEEPPPQVVFIFATTEYREIPRTILSRCQHFEFKKVAPSVLLEQLKKVAAGEGVTIEPMAADLIVRVAEGSLRDALSALDQVIAFSGTTVTDEKARTILGVVDRELILDFFQAVRGRDCDRIVAIVDTLFEKGYQPVEFLEDVLAQARDLLLARTVSDPAKYLAGTAEEIRALSERAALWSEDELLRFIEIVTREEGRIKNSTHARFLLEALGIRLARLADLKPIEEILAALEGPGGPTPQPGGPKPVGSMPPDTGRGTASAGRASPATPGPGSSRTMSAAPAPAAVMPVAEPLPAGVPVLSATDAPVPSQAFVEALLQRVHEERVTIGSMLEQAIWIQPAEDALRIVFSEKQTFFRDKVQSRDVTEYLKKTARELSGCDLRIVVETGAPGSFEPMALGAAAAPAPPAAVPGATFAAPRPHWVPPPRAALGSDVAPRGSSAGAPKSAPGRPAAPKLDDAERQALKDRALGDPSVRSMLELFGGELIDVEPL